MQDLVTLQRSPSSAKGSESLTRIHAPLDRSMILLQIVIQIRTSPTAAAGTQIPLSLQLFNHFRVRGIAVDIDYARPATSRNLQSALEKALRGGRIAFRRKPEIDRRTAGIHGAIEVAPLARHPNVSFVDPPISEGLPLVLPTPSARPVLRPDPAPRDFLANRIQTLASGGNGKDLPHSFCLRLIDNQPAASGVHVITQDRDA